jgi:hypothetical protein
MRQSQIPSLWLKVSENGLPATNLGKDSVKMISWQGFEQEDTLIHFGATKQQSSSTIRLRQVKLTILIRGSKGGGIHQNGNLIHILLGSIIPSMNHHKEDSMVVTRL